MHWAVDQAKDATLRHNLPRLLPIFALAILGCTAASAQPGTAAADLPRRDPAIRWRKDFDPSTATIFSHNEAVINASCPHVFAVLTDVSAWPEWLIFAREAHIDGPDKTIHQGTLVHLTMFGGPMDTLIAEYVPNFRLAWFPRGASEAKAQHYHAWLLIPQANACRVVTEETGISVDDSKRVAAHDTTMHRAHDLWLASLKWASETDTKHIFQTK